LYPGTDAARAEKLVDEIAGTGANAVALVASWRQKTVRSSSMSPGDVTVDDDVLRAAIARANHNGEALLGDGVPVLCPQIVA